MIVVINVLMLLVVILEVKCGVEGGVGVMVIGEVWMCICFVCGGGVCVLGVMMCGVDV